MRLEHSALHTQAQHVAYSRLLGGVLHCSNVRNLSLDCLMRELSPVFQQIFHRFASLGSSTSYCRPLVLVGDLVVCWPGDVRHSSGHSMPSPHRLDRGNGSIVEGPDGASARWE